MQNSANGTSVPLTLAQKCQWRGPRKNQLFLDNGTFLSIAESEDQSATLHSLRRNWDRVPEKIPRGSRQPPAGTAKTN
jgi:hypothetical protein